MRYSERKAYTEETLQDLRSRLSETPDLIDGKACIYATGSFGRGEASRNSDPDLFIGATASDPQGSDNHKKLSRLDEVCVKADLIRAIRVMKLPEFDGDGEYLRQHTIYDFKKNLGKADDDKQNTFTARLLLLLESKAVLGESVYHNILDSVVNIYWQDYEDHQEDFKPMFLVNDIQRLWRTLCVSYETKRLQGGDENPDRKKKARLKNFKLKYSRVMTCYSAILCLLSVYDKNGTVTPDCAKSLIKMSPLERIYWLRDDTSDATFNEIIESYEHFLEISSKEDTDLMEDLEDTVKGNKLLEEANEFGRYIAKALRKFDNDKGEEMLDRLLV